MKQISLQLYDEPPTGTPIYLAQISLGKRNNSDSTAWDNLAGEFSPIGWTIAAGHRLRIDWATINQTLTDTFVWRLPYWNADGMLTLGLDSLHPARVSIPLLAATGRQEAPDVEVHETHLTPTIVRGVLVWSATTPSLRNVGDIALQKAALLDIMGCKVLDLAPGANDVSRIAPGVYFVWGRGANGAGQATKIVIQR